MLDVSGDMLADVVEGIILAATGIAPEFIVPLSYDADVPGSIARSGAAVDIAVTIGARVDVVVDVLVASLISLFNDVIICGVVPAVGVDALTDASVNVLAVRMAALEFTMPALLEECSLLFC